MNIQHEPKATIVHLVETLEIGGLEHMVLALSKRLQKDRYRSAIFCLGHGGDLAEEARACGIDVTAFDKKEGLIFSFAFKLAKALRRERVDILHCHNYGPLVYGSAASRLAGVKGTVYTSHGMAASREKHQSMLYRLGGIKHIVAVSDNVRDLIIEASGTSPQRVTTIPNGIDTETYKAVSDSGGKKADLGLDGSVRLLGIVARLSPEKDHETLFEAFTIFGREHADVHLVVAGGGRMLAGLKDRARSLGIDSRVHFLGPRSDVAELLSVFDCFVLSSRMEGLSLTLLEAMAAGLPVVATDVGGNREVVQHEETGVLVPPADPQQMAIALKRIFSNVGWAKELGEKGRMRAHEHFSLDKMANGYERIYDELLG